MKDQFFGDIRDAFKYDLATEIVKSLTLRFVFITMLTENNGKARVTSGTTRRLSEKVGLGRRMSHWWHTYAGMMVSKNDV